MGVVRLDAAEVGHLLELFDQNGDGELGYSEFIRMLASTAN